MSLTVIKRPQGYILDTTQVTGVTVASSTGALFTKALHGLNTGDFIYIYSTLGSYNGYWYVNKNDDNSFRVREYSTASDQAFISSVGTITYYKSQLTHNWNCVHLPIVYKLKSDIWPTNGSDTARSITTFSNYNGYTYINASGDIKTTGTASAFEQVILSGTSVNGVYKILQWFSDTNFVINLPYSAGNVLSSGTVQYYYFNYCARIKIYAGISGTHTWTAQKPYTLLTEQRVIPDSNGIITLNISEFIKSKLEIISNNSIKDTLPNNIDAWCNFYIAYAESYDDSNGYTVSEFVSSYTNDSGNFEGYAINAKLPFKTQSQGVLSKYVYGITKQKWLTDFTRPTLFAGKYFDISYIKNNNASGDYIKRDLYRLSGGNYSLLTSIIDYQTDYDQGVYRYQITQSVNLEDRIDLTYYGSGNASILPTYSWSTISGVDPFDSMPGNKLILISDDGLPKSEAASQLFFDLIPNGSNIQFTLPFTISGSTNGFITVQFYNSDPATGSIVGSYSSGALTNGSYSPSINITLTGSAQYLVIRATATGAGPAKVINITVPSLINLYSAQLSETLTIDVNSKCSFTDFYLVWLNYLGGYNYWNFNAKKGKKYSIDILENKTQDVNIYNNWPNSYGEFADSITKQTKRRSKNKIALTSQLLTSAQEDAIKLITSSPLVQICTSQYDRQTVLVSNNSLYVRQDKDKSLSISLSISYTDEIPSQSL